MPAEAKQILIEEIEDWLFRLHSTLNYLRPGDYHKGNPEALLVERKRNLKAAALKLRGDELTE